MTGPKALGWTVITLLISTWGACGKKPAPRPPGGESEMAGAKPFEASGRDMPDVVDGAERDVMSPLRFYSDTRGETAEGDWLVGSMSAPREAEVPWSSVAARVGDAASPVLPLVGAAGPAGSEIHRPTEVDWIDVTFTAAVSNLPKDSVGVRVQGRHPCSEALGDIDLVDVGIANPTVGPVTRPMKLPGARYCFRGFDPGTGMSVTDTAAVVTRGSPVKFGLVYLGPAK